MAANDLAVTAAPDRAITAIDPEAAASALEHVLATGDLAQFSPKQRIGYYLYLCQKLDLDSEQRPFDWLTLDGRLVFYPNKNCAEQLRRKHQISMELVRKETTGDFFVVEVRGWRPNGQQDFASKYVSLRDQRGNRLTGRQYEHALHKAETGAKRRLTFSLVGLSAVPDQEDLRHARTVTVDAHGNVLDHPSEQQRYLAQTPAAAKVIGEPTFESTATPDDSPVQGGPSQAPTAEELERPRRTGPRPTFRPTEEQVEHWQKSWFVITKQSSLDDEDARHRYVAQWTASEGWPAGKQTGSLPIMFGRMTEREAGDFLQHVRALVDDERRANAEALAEHNAAAEQEADADGGAF